MINRKIKFVTLALIVALFMVGCSNGNNSIENDGNLSITDMKGRQIQLEDAAKRIVTLTAADCEILYAIGGGDALVGRGEYCDYPLEVLEIPEVQSGSQTNIEQLIALEPEVVVMSIMDQTEDQIAALENAGIKVVVTDANNIEGVYEAIQLIGKVAGKDKEADGLIQEMKTGFDNLRKEADSGEEKTVYFEVSPLEYGLWTAGNQTFMGEIAEIIGLKNIFADVRAWGEISQEQVIDRNPDYIVSSTMYYGDGPTPEEEIKARKGWENITAVKNNAILHANSDEITRPGPRLVDAAYSFYSFIYGE